MRRDMTAHLEHQFDRQGELGQEASVIKLSVKTLTPIWTGGSSGQVDRVHETGILGSLRWWMEVLARGVGGRVCDPSQGTCRFDAERYEKSKATEDHQRLRDAGLCDVCQVFGATGWRRKFRLSLHQESDLKNAKISSEVRLNNRQYSDSKANQRTPTWYFRDPISSHSQPNTPKEGTLGVEIWSLDSSFNPNIIAGLMQFIADWGALGARAQMGFGVIQLTGDRVNMQTLYDWLIARTGNETYPTLPSLRNIFLARISPSDDQQQFTEQSPFILKYDLRRLFADNQALRHFIMGTVKGQRIAAKVKMSRPYNNQIRLWGWIPEKAGEYLNSWNREKIVNTIYQHLNEKYRLQLWRGMNPTSNKDTMRKDALDFLQELFSGA